MAMLTAAPTALRAPRLWSVNGPALNGAALNGPALNGSALGSSTPDSSTLTPGTGSWPAVRADAGGAQATVATASSSSQGAPARMHGVGQQNGHPNTGNTAPDKARPVAGAGNAPQGDGHIGRDAGHAAPSPSSLTSTVAPTAPVALSRAELAELLLKVVEEKTGYPRDMVGLDQNLEGDLGIDSIKRIEVVGGVLGLLPGSIKSGLADRRGELNTQPTLDGMLDILSAGTSSADGSPGSPPQVATVLEGARPFDAAGAGEATQTGSLPRYVLTTEVELAGPERIRQLDTGHFVLCVDRLGVADEVERRLNRAGCTVSVIQVDDLLDDASLRERISGMLASIPSGQIAGFLHLAALGRPALPRSASVAEVRRELLVAEKSLFLLVQALDPHLTKGARILAVSGLGGTFARTPMRPSQHQQNEHFEPQLQFAGGAVGLLKSYREERPDLRPKAVDVDVTLSPGQLADQIMDELVLCGGRLEVGYPQGNRTVFRTQREELPAPGEPSAPLEHLVVLATGGARGVTAEVLRELASSHNTLILLGRRPLPAPEPDSTAHLLTETALRTHLIAEVRAGRIHLTPAQVGKQIAEVLAARELRANLTDLEARGAIVEYHAVDVTDEAALSKLVELICQRHDGIDGIVHGAGLIEDKRVVDKTSESWSRVVETKVLGAFCLQKHVPIARLKFFAVLSSVAGRYGNSGQADYATANELMNRLCAQLQSQYGMQVNVLALCWGPWGPTLFGTGMVTKETEEKFAEKGVRLVSAAVGRQLFSHEVFRRAHEGQPVEVVFGEGPWEAREAELGRWERPWADTTYGALLPNARHRSEPQGDQVLSFELDERHDYLRDHVVDGVAVVPAAVVAEQMAEGAAACWPGWTVAEVMDCRLLKGIELKGAPRRFELVLSAAPYGSSEGFEVTATLRSLPGASSSARVQPMEPARSGEGGAGVQVHYRATVRLAQQLGPYDIAVPGGALTVPSGLDVMAIYDRFLFHGDRFQVITRVVGLGPSGAVAEVRATSIAEFLGPSSEHADAADKCAPFQLDPALLDAAPQLAIVWARQQRGETCLPVRFGCIRRVRALCPGSVLQMRLVVRSGAPAQGSISDGRLPLVSDDSKIIADVFYTDAEQGVVMVIEELECVASEALNRLATRHPLHENRLWSPLP